MNSKPVRIGIVGCGSVMRDAYMPLAVKLRCQGLVEVVVACDRMAERGRAICDQFGIARATTDFRDVVNADDVDLVLVLTSMLQHGEIAHAALSAGKHVLVEKPMAVSLGEASELLKLAQSSRSYLLPAPHVILSDTFQAMARRLREDAIGQVSLARARYGWAGPDWGTWFYQSGGGALFDLGVYNVTSLTGWFGPAKRVMAMTDVAIPEREINGRRVRVETEDNAQILIDFGSACFAVVTTGFTMQRYRTPAIELYGTTGTLQMLGDDWAPEGYELWQNAVGAWQVFLETNRAWPWTDGLRHLVECIRTGTRPVITPEHAYHVLEIMVKAQEAGREGRALEITSTFTPPQFESAHEAEAPHRVHAPKRS